MYFEAAAVALRTHWNQDPIFVREGGTSPNTSFLEATIGAPCLHFPLGQASDHAHLQNERIRLRNLSVGQCVLRDFFALIAHKIK